VAGTTAFKAICGSSPATAATFASVAIPEMDHYGYDKRLSTGAVASVGTLGILIPPSVTLIVFGIITEQSIGRLFLAGIVPSMSDEAPLHSLVDVLPVTNAQNQYIFAFKLQTVRFTYRKSKIRIIG
jgi:TRAP-type C4-dicarboxylate transport system permease large subunit